MSRMITLMVLAALTRSATALADGSPPWTDLVKRSVVRINVPRRDRIPPQEGTGFFVGLKNHTGYLVTASHVIWPSGVPDKEQVTLTVELRGCDPPVPAIADSEKASGKTELDVALVKIKLGDIPSDASCQDLIRNLPRNIIDPDGDSLPENTHAWIIGRGEVVAGRDARPIVFKKYDGSSAQFDKDKQFVAGDSGSPVFSADGHIIAMIVTAENALATKFSLIWTKLNYDWESPTNLAGPASKLSFSNQYRGKALSIDGAPDMALKLPQPAPLGKIALKLQLDDTRAVMDMVDVTSLDMNCEVAISRWLARHKRAAVYTTLGLVAITGGALGGGILYQHNFDKSPSRASYDRVGMSNMISIGVGSAALAALGATVVGYLSSDRDAITCAAVNRDHGEGAQ